MTEAEILKERAAALARGRQEKAPEAGMEVLVFQLAAESYGIETRFVREVAPLHDLTPIPCTPAFVLGIINLRGELCPVIDLKRLLGLPDRDLTNATRAIVLKDESMEVGLIADVVTGVQTVSGIAAPPATFSGLQAGFLRGIAPGRIAILEASSILSHPSIVVNEQVDN